MTDLFFGHLPLVEIGFQQAIIVLREQVNTAIQKGLVVTAEAVVHQIGIFYAKLFWAVEWNDRGGQFGLDLLDQRLGLGARPVDLVDKDDRGNAKLLEDRHEEFGLRLNPFYGGDDKDRAVKDAKGTLHFGDKVGMAGGVNQVDF